MNRDNKHSVLPLHDQSLTLNPIPILFKKQHKASPNHLFLLLGSTEWLLYLNKLLFKQDRNKSASLSSESQVDFVSTKILQQIKIMVYWVVYHSFTFRILKTTCCFENNLMFWEFERWNYGKRLNKLLF